MPRNVEEHVAGAAGLGNVTEDGMPRNVEAPVATGPLTTAQLATMLGGHVKEEGTPSDAEAHAAGAVGLGQDEEEGMPRKVEAPVASAVGLGQDDEEGTPSNAEAPVAKGPRTTALEAMLLRRAMHGGH
eukprot:5830360-Pyramimonas_sp.AAC.1